MLKRLIAVFCILTSLQSCQTNERSKGEELFNQQCARCHIAPDIQDLPYNIWEKNILPDMGARMGLQTPDYDPYKGYSYEETIAMMATNTYPKKPVITREEWNILKEYILSKAPDSLRRAEPLPELKMEMDQFDAIPVQLDNNPGSLITYLEYMDDQGEMAIGDIQNQLRIYNFGKDTITRTITASSPVIAYNKIEDAEYLTEIGRLNPSEIPSGKFSVFKNDSLHVLKKKLHRPVHTLAKDLDDDGNTEFIISEFGHFTGKASLFKKVGDSLSGNTLIFQPGTIRVVAEDMNNDGKQDLVALTSQGDENITILYQDAPLEFRADKVIQFSPVYGSSWFEVMDYDNDGDMDIATVQGDNADKSQIPKPYHGLRIYLNDGDNNFKEAYFYPLNGATRLLARDFDQDGDIDFALIATFPDYDNAPNRSFVYLENKDSKNFTFSSSTFKSVKNARWFLMDAGDTDNDGDLDIIISAFSYSFNPIPNRIKNVWDKHDLDIMLLKNNLIESPGEMTNK